MFKDNTVGVRTKTLTLGDVLSVLRQVEVVANTKISGDFKMRRKGRGVLLIMKPENKLD